MRQRNTLVILFILLLTLALAACGGDDEAPAAERSDDAPVVADESPTAVPTEAALTTTDDATDAPAASTDTGPTAVTLEETITSNQGGFSVGLPLGYEANESGGSIDLSRIAGEQIDPRIFIAGGPAVGEPAAVLADFANSMSDDVTLGEVETVTLAGLTGAAADLEGEEDGQPITGRMLVVGSESQVLIIFAAAAPDRWSGEGAAVLDAVLGSLEIFEPNLAEEAPAGSGPVTVSARGSSDPGFACFGSSGRGLACLSADGEWQVYTRETSDLGGDFISRLAVCPDGTMLIAHSSGIDRYDGTGFENYDDAWDGGGPDSVACAADGSIWVAHFEGVSLFDGSSWTTFPASELATEEYAGDLVYDVAIDGAGTVWALTPNTIASYDGSAWTRYQTGEGLDQEFFFDRLLVDATGTVWVTAGNGVLEFVAGVWDYSESDDFISIKDGAVDGDNQLYLATFSDGVQVFNGATWRTLEGDLSTQKTRSVAVDGNGRLWVGTTFGLNVRDGDAWTTYTMDSADLAANEITGIAVVNGGPTLPPPVDKPNGSMIGRITEDETAVADTQVEICVQKLFSSFSGATPCSDQPIFFSTTTDADGNFSFTDLPVGDYVLTVQTADGWALLQTDFGIGSELVPIFAGEETDVGELFIEADE